MISVLSVAAALILTLLLRTTIVPQPTELFLVAVMICAPRKRAAMALRELEKKHRIALSTISIQNAVDFESGSNEEKVYH